MKAETAAEAARWSVLAAGREAPEAAALVVDGQVYTWAAVATRVERLLDALPHGDGPVALLGATRLRVVLGLLTLIEAGRTAFVLHPRLQPREVAAQLAAVGVASLWEPPSPETAQEARTPRAAPPPIADARDLAWIATSGSSGAPRIVALSRRAFLASSASHAANLPFAPGDRWHLTMPLGHIGGLSILTRCLLHRAAITFSEPPEGLGHRPFSAARLRAQLAESGATLLSVVPTMLQQMIDQDPSPPPLRAILLGGAAAPAGLLRRAAEQGWPVLATYGLTEACSQVCTWRPGTRPDPAEGAGPPLPGIALRIVDGEVQVRGEILLSETLPRGLHPSPLTEDGWLRTGDLGELDQAGRLHLRGRRSTLIITGGENVSPEEVEAVLLELPGVRAAVVFGVPDPVWGQQVGAAVVLADGVLADGVLADGALETVIAQARERLAPHRRPRRWAVLDALPLGPSGKVDRGAALGLAQKQLQDD